MLMSPAPNGRPATVLAEDAIAIYAAPQPDGIEAQSAVVPMMSEKLNTIAEDGSKTSGENQDLSTVEASVSNEQGVRTNGLSRAVRSPSSVEEQQSVQPPSSPQSSPIHIRGPVRIQRSSPANVSAENAVVPESDSPTLLRDSFANHQMNKFKELSLETQKPDTGTELLLEPRITGFDIKPSPIQESQRSEFLQPITRDDHMITIDSSPQYASNTQRSDSLTPIPEISLDDHMAAVDMSPFNIEDPKDLYSPKFIPDSFLDISFPVVGISPLTYNDMESSNSPKHSSLEDHMANPPDVAENDRPPESMFDKDHQTTESFFGTHIPEYFSNTQDQPDSSSDGRRHPESSKSQDDPGNKDGRRRVLREAKLHSLHSRNLQTRALAYEKRSQLHQVRSYISAADEEFMKLVRKRRVQGSVDDMALEASFKRLQDTRDQYGPMEDAYTALEERLDREEYEVAQLEEELLEQEILAPDSQDSDYDLRKSDAAFSEIEAMRESQHPLYDEYMSALGDADLCREEHSDLLIENENLLHAQQVRQRVGRELQPEDQATLTKFPKEEARIVEKLRHIEAEIERLKFECIREGLLGEGEVEAGEIDILKSSNSSIEPEQAEYEKYPLLLQQPGQDEDEKRSKVLISGFLQGDTGDRITCWMLHKLRLSCIEVELLARYAENEGPTMNTEKWQEEVLDFWFVDSANLSASAYEIEPTLTAFPRSPLTFLDKAGTTQFGDTQFIHLVIRSSLLSRKLEFGRLLKIVRMRGSSVVSL